MNAVSSMGAIGGLNGMEGGASVNFSAEHPANEPTAARSKGVTHVRPFTRVEAAIAAVESLDRELKKFELAVADSLQDYLGVQMAQITDCALARGWEPVSFMQKDGFRVYRYEAMPAYKGRRKKR
ncbi:hypothetical protein [Variovorax sp. Root411]|uniref:hypothetical protein n=1 Tax=Variovorax sp. Root411 TaxID=1736530 RepID=UPI0006F2C93B|nr:hypothetical protein [Variovorax sp. Root411]KQW57221.1 hypothetical protein ASC92_13255 [Variovorax sp. Root411]